MCTYWYPLERDLSVLLSFHQCIGGGGGPPEGKHVGLWGCWVEKTLFWLAVLISCGADEDSLWAWRALVGPLLPCHDSSKWQPLKRSELSAYLRRCPQVLTSAATSQKHHKLHWLWNSHVSHSRLTFHPPLWTAALTAIDYLHRDKLSTSSSIHLAGCLTGWQPRVPTAMQKAFILWAGYKPQRHISTCISKMNGI